MADATELYQLGLTNLEAGWLSNDPAKLSAAADLLDRALKGGCKDAEFTLAQLHSSKKFPGVNPKIAIDLYESMLRENPNDTEVMLALGVIYCTAGQMEGRDYKLPDGTAMPRECIKGRNLIEKYYSSVNPSTLDSISASKLGNLYTGGWLREDRSPTNEDLKLAIKLLTHALEACNAENKSDAMKNIVRQQLENSEARLKNRT